MFKAASTFAAISWDVIKPGQDKQGYSGKDAKDAAFDLYITSTGACKFTRKVMAVEHRICCQCKGCQMWDNETELRKNAEWKKRETERRSAEIERAQRLEQLQIEEACKQSCVGYSPPQLLLPSCEPPKPKDDLPKRALPVQTAVSEPAPELSPGPAPADLLDISTDVKSLDLLGDPEKSQSITDLLMAHASLEQDDDDLIDLCPTDAKVDGGVNLFDGLQMK